MDSLRTLGTMIMSVEFLNYMIFIVIVSSVLIYYSPKYGERSVVVYVLICSLVGSLSVMSCKGITSLHALLPAALFSILTRWLLTNPPFIRTLIYSQASASPSSKR